MSRDKTLEVEIIVVLLLKVGRSPQRCCWDFIGWALSSSTVGLFQFAECVRGFVLFIVQLKKESWAELSDEFNGRGLVRGRRRLARGSLCATPQRKYVASPC